MKSTIKIALGQNNEPVINLVAIQTDDIRDQLCRQWIERLGGESNLAYARFGEQSRDTAGDYCVHMEISPLGPKSHLLNHGLITDLYNSLSKNHRHIAMLTGSSTINFQDTTIDKVSSLLDRDMLRELSIIDLVRIITDNFNELISQSQSTTSSTESNRLPSKFQIEDDISTDDIFDGQVTAVRFTVGKVYYDILDKLSGKVIRDVDSAHVIQNPVKLSQAD